MATNKPIVRYKILHIPTGGFLHTFNSKTRQYDVAIFANKAMAGHAIEDYRKQDFRSRSYFGQGLFLEVDIKVADTRNDMSPYYVTQRIKHSLQEHGEFHKAEFDYVPMEE